MGVSRFFMIAQGMTVRCLFCAAAMISVFGVVTVKQQQAYWLLLNLSFLLFLEAAITFTRTKTGEWKWFCPSVLLFLVATVPSLWLLELTLLSERIEYSSAHGADCISAEDVEQNQTQLEARIAGVTLPLFLTTQSWSVALQQALLFVLILGRWLLPKGELSRDQLSQLLLVYIGIAADILEFVTENLKLEQVRCNSVMVVCILSLWTWSLMQFTLGLTATKARKPRVAGTSQRKKKKEDTPPKVTFCCETEVWGIMATVIMQDGPFLTMRLYLLTVEEAVNHMMVFFTCKNMLIMLLQVYRLLVICVERPESQSSMIVRTVVRYRDASRRYVHEHSAERRRQKLVHHDIRQRNRGHQPSPKHSVSQHRLLPEIDHMSPDQLIMAQASPLLPSFPLTIITGQERGVGDGGNSGNKRKEDGVRTKDDPVVDQREELSDYDNTTADLQIHVVPSSPISKSPPHATPSF